MDLFSKQDNWKGLITKLSKKFPELTEADLNYEEGMEECMLRMVEYKLRKTKQEMRDIILGIGYLPIERL